MPLEISEASSRNNNFDFLRLSAAIMVVLFHSYALLMLYRNDPLLTVTGFMDFGVLGVAIFFIISGFLITKSWHDRPSLIKYYWSRFLRIVPALVCLALLTVFVIGPAVTSLKPVDYFSDGLTWSYFRVVTVLGIFPHTPNLPGVFIDNPYHYAVNGSLWTLPVEFAMYILVSLLGLVGLIYRKNLMLILAAAASLIFLACNISELYFLRNAVDIGLYRTIFGIVNQNGYILIFPVFFMVGSVCYLYHGRVKYSWKMAIPLLLIWFLSFKSPLFYPLSFVCLPYIVLSIAYLKLPYVSQIGKYGDFSYGIYIYAFLVQQTIIYFVRGISILPLFFLSISISFVLAFLSWRLVESKALRLKKIDPLSLFGAMRDVLISGKSSSK